LTTPRDRPALLPARRAAGGIILHLRVTPKAGSDEVLGVERRADGAVLKLRVRALPEKGEANDAVVAALAKWLGLPSNGLKVKAGHKVRQKQVFVAGDSAALMAKIAALTGGGEHP
jgi:hypothetical protein